MWAPLFNMYVVSSTFDTLHKNVYANLIIKEILKIQILKVFM